ncbi:hypothetical protein ACQKWADRAFT_316070 [Trichoderma austrokoningii]
MGDRPSLLLAVSHVAARRQQEAKHQREELGHEHEQQELTLKAEEVRKAEEEEEEEEAKYQELAAAAARERVQAWKHTHDEKARHNYFSRAQVDDEVLRMVTQVDNEIGLSKRRMDNGTEEPHEEWRARMISLRQRIYALWNENEERIRGGLPRYVEGVAVREGIVPPTFLGDKRRMVSGLGACLQCVVLGLACSREVVTGWRSGRALKSRGCGRCERKGYRCVVEYVVDDGSDDEGVQQQQKTKEYEWGWVDEDVSDVEALRETLEMWKRQKRGDRLEVVGGSMQWVEAGGFALPSCEKMRHVED